MRLLRFEKDGRARYGALVDGGVHCLKGDYFGTFEVTAESYDVREVKILAPSEPSKVVCVGLNYADHARELNMPIPDEPIIFIKPSTSVIGHDDAIVYPKETAQLDHEAELAVVIKNEIRSISPDEVKANIVGYTCLNDVTARDLQKKDGQWTRAKSFDTFCPVGPWIVDDAEPNDLHVELRLNGRVMQSSSTRQFIFKVEEVVSFVSNVMTLVPGDIIATGTPPGVSPMQRGDVVEVGIEKIGTLRNSVV